MHITPFKSDEMHPFHVNNGQQLYLGDSIFYYALKMHRVSARVENATKPKGGGKERRNRIQ